MHILLAVIYLAPYYFYCVTKSFLLQLLPRRFRPKKNIEGQTVLITGAGSGVGRALAIEFSKLQTHIVLVDINMKSLYETEKLMDRRSSTFLYECDVSDSKMVYELAKKVKEEAGTVDILVNNAGVVVGKDLINLPDEGIRKTIEVNSLAHFWTCKAFLPGMTARNKGHIVSIASVVGYSGVPKLSDYCASKFAAIGFAESLMYELAQQSMDGVKVTLVCPTIISTGLFEGAYMPFSGTLTPEYVAREVVQGVLEDKDYIILPRYFSLFIFLKNFIPYKVAVAGMRATGGLNCMEEFKGGRDNVLNNNSDAEKGQKIQE